MKRNLIPLVLGALAGSLLMPLLLGWLLDAWSALAGSRVGRGEENNTVLCGRCGNGIQKDDAEVCWYCVNWLCVECWDMYGHCGHKEADEINERARQVPQPRRETPLIVESDEYD